MKPFQATGSWRFLLCIALFSVGCTGPAVRSQSPESTPATVGETTLVGDLARPYGMEYIKVEAVSLVTGLNGQGADPPPSPQRAVVLSEMKRRNVAEPGRILESPDTALVLVRGYLRPGIQKGDHFDVEVRVPSRSEVTSLRGGWLLESRMTELAVLGNQIRNGRLLALAEGAVLVDPSSGNGQGENSVHQTRGRVLGGATALKSRSLGLVLYDENQTVRTSQQLGRAINLRFHTYLKGVKQGVANPKTDKFIELVVHPRYQDNVTRYMQVIRNLAYRETPRARQTRLNLLERQLFDPVTVATAALRLEAIGEDGIEILRKALPHEDPELRFYAAESLAYLDESDAAEALGDIARGEPAFRARALAALGAMNGIASHDELRQMLSEASAETRYGAFRALWLMNPNDSVIRGQVLGGQFGYHRLDVEGPSMIHITRSKRPEIVLFGKNQELVLPTSLDAGKDIIVRGTEDGQVTVSRFAVGKPDQKRNVSNRVDEVIRAIVDLGGTYPDVVQALQQAKDNGSLASRLKVDSLPKSNRRYQRPDEGLGDEEPVDGPLPGLFKRLYRNGV